MRLLIIRVVLIRMMSVCIAVEGGMKKMAEFEQRPIIHRHSSSIVSIFHVRGSGPGTAPRTSIPDHPALKRGGGIGEPEVVC
jgi:hypothetical protein